MHFCTQQNVRDHVAHICCLLVHTQASEDVMHHSVQCQENETTVSVADLHRRWCLAVLVIFSGLYPTADYQYCTPF